MQYRQPPALRAGDAIDGGEPARDASAGEPPASRLKNDAPSSENDPRPGVLLRSRCGETDP